jgi:hypothetical protein
VTVAVGDEGCLRERDNNRGGGNEPMARVVTITDPAKLLLAQLQEIRRGNARTREEIKRQQTLLKGGEQEELKLEQELEILLARTKVEHRQ